MPQYLYNPGYLKELCEQYRISPSKSYGQHYLISDAPIKKMIAAAELTSDDTVVEIGPGFGVLTLAIAPLVKKVVAFEIEKKLELYWQEQIIKNPNIEIVWGNALQQIPNSRFQIPDSHYKVMANLPYGITSDILRLLLEAEPKPEKVIVMVQKEVGERIVAQPSDMSLLSVAVQYYGEPRIAAQVPRGSFWPAPNVDSVVVAVTLPPYHFTTLPPNHFSDTEFFRVVKAGFAQKRKQLWGNLSAGLHLPGEQVKEVLRDVVGNEKVRAEELSVEQWLKIVDQLIT